MAVAHCSSKHSLALETCAPDWSRRPFCRSETRKHTDGFTVAAAVSAAMTAVYVPITARRILRDRIGESEDTGFRWRSDVFRRIPLRTGKVTISADWEPNALPPQPGKLARFSRKFPGHLTTGQ